VGTEGPSRGLHSWPDRRFAQTAGTGLGRSESPREGRGGLVSFADREEKYTVTISPRTDMEGSESTASPTTPGGCIAVVCQPRQRNQQLCCERAGKRGNRRRANATDRPRHCASQPRNLVPDCPLSESTNALAGNVVHPRLHTSRSPGAQTQVFSPEPISGRQSEPPGAV
jgi:hypothetical protein